MTEIENVKKWVITNGKYHVCTVDRKFCISKKEENITKFKSMVAANNFIASQSKMLSSYSGMFPKLFDVPMTYIPISEDEIMKSVTRVGDKLKILQNNRHYLRIKLKDLDNETQDLLHLIELDKPSASGAYHQWKMLHDVRIKRREIKDQLKIIDTILNTSSVEITNGELSKKLESIKHQKYFPRVRHELFKGKRISLA
jgi:hypothetical protein